LLDRDLPKDMLRDDEDFNPLSGVLSLAILL